ncbi:hypothetical protein [Mucilaginibacter polytrichastri]|uniref:Uncharacterized protein n=1 Tax=Mucilaginibacter polytrichastri TaxID=1302689 RepID=A0A1Q5ZSR0_9SPHI|nr:hypothetical protein [Mucilaginibacter polytrichastri]OKS84810.1 hypothetical protein RG47T_0245 [Mucilaginibacter polytrichastri]SFS49132.1 hypothetical protein SAMN04487890_101827 [Mucilaginibacter polytrichastri]
MLELKHWVDKEISVEPFIARYIEKMTAAIKTLDPERTEAEIAEMAGLISAGIKRVIFKQPQLFRLEQNIAEIVHDYSEIDPFFAYDLTGKYQLTENLELMKEYLTGVVPEDSDMPEATAFMNQLLRPTMLADLQRDLITHLPQIAKMINDHTLKTINENHLSQKAEIDEDGLENYCEEMIPRLMASVASLAEQQPA